MVILWVYCGYTVVRYAEACQKLIKMDVESGKAG